MAEAPRFSSASFVAEIEGSEAAIPIEIEPLGADRYRARIEDRVLELEARTIGARSFSVAIGDAIHEIAVTRRDKTIVVSSARGHVALQLVDRRRYRAEGGQAGAGGQREIKAVMPGKVIAVLVKVGDKVEKDQALLVLEAMKMENEVKSPRAGVVREISVTPNQTVETGELMISLE